MTLLLMALLGLSQPQDPFQYTATQALCGRYGKLLPWQETAYRAGLLRGCRADRRAYLTSYGPFDPPAMFGGPYAADRNMTLTEAHCAADKQVPFGSYVWAKGAVRICRDRGGAVSVRTARSVDARNDRHLDFYCRDYARFSSESTVYALIGKVDR